MHKRVYEDNVEADLLTFCVLLCSTLLAGSQGLENAKRLVTEYKTGKLQHMTPELWHAKKIVDSTLHPGMEPRIRPWKYAGKKKED